MFNFIKKIFKNKWKTKKMTPQKYRFNIEVYDKDIDESTGNEIVKLHGTQTVVMNSENELKAVYGMCDQIVKIIDKQPIYEQTNQNEAINEQQKKVQDNSHQVTKDVEVKQIEQKTIQKPTYYKIGNVELKNDNGVIYQRQWMQVSPSESQNLRVINTLTNKLVNMNGKHFEIKRWVKVENSENDSDLIDGDLND